MFVLTVSLIKLSFDFYFLFRLIFYNTYQEYLYYYRFLLYTTTEFAVQTQKSDFQTVDFEDTI